MNEVVMLYESQAEEILNNAIEERTPAIMSYLSRDRWHVAKLLLTGFADDRLTAQRAGCGARPYPINIQINQPVGLSFKYSYGKFVFDTTVVALEPSQDTACQQQGGNIILAAPDHGKVIQRRSYFRINVPESLNVKVTLWHRGDEGRETRDERRETRDERRETRDERRNYYQGKLVDISAGGAQVMVPYEDADAPEDRKQKTEDRIQNSDSCLLSPDTYLFKRGQFIGLRFTPMPYEMPLIINAQIRRILPSEDKTKMYLGLQMVGLEASLEGHQILSRIAEIVERYHQLTLSGAKELVARSGDLNLSTPRPGSERAQLETDQKRAARRKKELPLLCL